MCIHISQFLGDICLYLILVCSNNWLALVFSSTSPRNRQTAGMYEKLTKPTLIWKYENWTLDTTCLLCIHLLYYVGSGPKSIWKDCFRFSVIIIQVLFVFDGETNLAERESNTQRRYLYYSIVLKFDSYKFTVKWGGRKNFPGPRLFARFIIIGCFKNRAVLELSILY